MKTIETTVKIDDDHILRAETTLEKGTYRAVIVLEELPKQSNDESPKPKARQFGTAKGKIWMADDFDETPEEFKDYM